MLYHRSHPVNQITYCFKTVLKWHHSVQLQAMIWACWSCTFGQTRVLPKWSDISPQPTPQCHGANNAMIYLVCYRCVFQVLTAASLGFPLIGNKTRWHHQHNQIFIVIASPSLKWAEDFAHKSCSCSFISPSKFDIFEAREQQHEKVFWRCAWTMSC